MNETQQILKAIQDVEKRTTEAIQGVEKRLTTKLDEQGKTLESHGKQLTNLTQVVMHTNTALEALAEGQREIRETMATKADVLDLGVKLNKNHTETKTRLKNLEEHTGTTDPTKN